jgi:cytochrome P450
MAARVAAGEATLDLYALLRRLTLAIAGRSMFSLEMDAFGERLRALMRRYMERHAAVRMLDMLLPPRLPSPADIGRRAFQGEWRRFMDEVLAAREAEPSPDPGGAPRDLFDLLLAARDPETGEGFSRDGLRDEVSTLILAGHETTAVALFWSCHLAVLFPEQQERIAEEAARADLSPAGAAEALGALPETRAHLDGAMRLYPPAYLIVREARVAERLPGTEVRVAPRAVVSIAPWVLHRHRLLWEEPEHFDPARFRPGAPAPDRFVYMPFGAGPRICVGARFALAEATLVLARLLREFRLEFAGDGAVVPLGRVTTQPDRVVPFRLVPRR